ncbi:SlyX family protein [Alphaproteobacteria bacterium]|nr:SlyX family protein [Alphaproteobacteria bacterium]
MSDKNTLEHLALRIAALEETLTHQSLAIEELSQQMHEAQQAREKSDRKQKALFQILQEIEDKAGEGQSLPREKPPHY